MRSGQSDTLVVQADDEEMGIETILLEGSIEDSHSGDVGGIDHGHK